MQYAGHRTLQGEDNVAISKNLREREKDSAEARERERDTVRDREREMQVLLCGYNGKCVGG